jgi:hypothetical protein
MTAWAGSVRSLWKESFIFTGRVGQCCTEFYEFKRVHMSFNCLPTSLLSAYRGDFRPSVFFHAFSLFPTDVLIYSGGINAFLIILK